MCKKKNKCEEVMGCFLAVTKKKCINVLQSSKFKQFWQKFPGLSKFINNFVCVHACVRYCVYITFSLFSTSIFCVLKKKNCTCLL